MLLRETIGEVLRRHRLDQDRTLRDVSDAAAVSLGYLSEVERGKKEPSSELLGSICEALDVPIPALLREVSDELETATGSVVVALAGARTVGTVDVLAA
jgi:transcriptional regulator with XRE-family HTH domain